MNNLVMPVIKMEGYVIINLQTGLFSSGGAAPKFKKKGKIWSTIGHCKSHISMISSYARHYYKSDGEDWRTEFDMNRHEILRSYRGCKVYEIHNNVEVLDVYSYMVDHVKKEMKRYGYTVLLNE